MLMFSALTVHRQGLGNCLAFSLLENNSGVASKGTILYGMSGRLADLLTDY
jgi:hypothetical protein